MKLVSFVLGRVTSIDLFQTGLKKYQLLSEKDQRALLLLTGFFALFILYFVIWAPIRGWSNDRALDYYEQKEVLTWVRGNISRSSHQATVRVREVDSGSLSAQVSEAARESAISVSRMRPDEKGLRVWIDKAPYQNLIQWILELEQGQELMIDQLQINQTDNQGLVKAYLFISV
ncbi:MAG: type II secretion system protein GspM [Endozoicomonas sp.]|uniref:type II secretion system protein GspM n=1 Tax=Endozoicomonas sp. TaxID=1892382 RepID=UPI003D9BAE3F